MSNVLIARNFLPALTPKHSGLQHFVTPFSGREWLNLNACLQDQHCCSPPQTPQIPEGPVPPHPSCRTSQSAVDDDLKAAMTSVQEKRNDPRSSLDASSSVTNSSQGEGIPDIQRVWMNWWRSSGNSQEAVNESFKIPFIMQIKTKKSCLNFRLIIQICDQNVAFVYVYSIV